MSIAAEGKFAFADVWDGTLRACRRTLWILSILGIVTIALAIFLSIEKGEGWFGEPLFLGLGVFWIAYLWPFMAYRTRATLKKTPGLQGNVRFQFDESGYALETMQARAEVKWAALSKWSETKKSFLLYQNPRIGSVVPKRFFQSPGDVDAARNLLIASALRKS